MEVAGALSAARVGEVTREADIPSQRLRRVFAKAGDGLFRFLSVRTGDAHAAEDLLQQVCFVAAGRSELPEPDEALEAFLFGIARNVLRRHWRDRARAVTRVELGSAETQAVGRSLEEEALPEDRLKSGELRTAVLSAITALPSAEQELIFAFYFDGRSQSEIANETGTSVRSIEAKLYRVRQRLRNLLSGEERDGDQ